jgi:hypothetical protein
MILDFDVDMYTKTIEYNAAGQPQNVWTFERTMKCDFTPARSEERLVGRLQNPTSYFIRVGGGQPIEASKQLRDLRDRQGNVIEAGPFNIIGIRKYRGWSSISHITIFAQKVLE